MERLGREEGRHTVVHECADVSSLLCACSAPYIIVVTAATVVGTAGGASNLHRVDSVEFLPFQRSPEHSTLTKQQQRDESHFLNMMASVFRTQSFYFGQDYEITHSAQRIAELRASDPSVTGPETWRRADDRFLWNAQFLTEFAKARDELHGVDEWITPVICGCVVVGAPVCCSRGPCCLSTFPRLRPAMSLPQHAPWAVCAYVCVGVLLVTAVGSLTASR